MHEGTRLAPSGLGILLGLQPKYRRGSTEGRPLVRTDLTIKHVYAGTVDPAVVHRRREANKAARRSRRINRQRSGR